MFVIFVIMMVSFFCTLKILHKVLSCKKRVNNTKANNYCKVGILSYHLCRFVSSWLFSFCRKLNNCQICGPSCTMCLATDIIQNAVCNENYCAHSNMNILLSTIMWLYCIVIFHEYTFKAIPTQVHNHLWIIHLTSQVYVNPHTNKHTLVSFNITIFLHTSAVVYAIVDSCFLRTSLSTMWLVPQSVHSSWALNSSCENVVRLCSKFFTYY